MGSSILSFPSSSNIKIAKEVNVLVTENALKVVTLLNLMLASRLNIPPLYSNNIESALTIRY